MIDRFTYIFSMIWIVGNADQLINAVLPSLKSLDGRRVFELTVAHAINKLQAFVNEDNADCKLCIISSEASAPLMEKIIEVNLYIYGKVTNISPCGLCCSY
jgi:hypothetical protein